MKNGSSRSLSFILSFLLKMVEEEGRKILSLLSLSLSLLNTTSARSNRDEVALGRSSGKKIGVGFELGKESRSEPDGGSFSLAFALSSVFLSFSLGERKKNCVKDMRVHVTSSFLFCLGFYNKP